MRSAWLSAILLASLLPLCADPRPSGSALALEADTALLPRLSAMAKSCPLPAGWHLSKMGETAAATLALEILPPESDLGPGELPFGSLYLAASVELQDATYSVGASEAESRGLVPLETIDPPRRALAVDGILPGSQGYPFSRKLAVVMRADGKDEALSAWLESASRSAVSSDRRPLILAAAGDIQVGEEQWPLLLEGEDGLATLLRGGALDLLRRSDLAVANLESPISSRGVPNPRKHYHFRMPAGSSSWLKEAGLGMLLLANNHALDYGLDAFMDTLADLDATSTPYVGAGKSLAAAAAPRFVDSGPGGSLAFVGFACFPDESQGFTLAEAAAGQAKAGVDADLAAALISVRVAAASGAPVVVLAHGGNEYIEAPPKATRELFAKFAEAGAALVIGTHPHQLQGCEARSGCLIAYSLGNFIFTDEAEPPQAWRGAVLHFLIYRGKVRAVMPFPILALYDYTMAEEDPALIEDRLSALSALLAPVQPR